MGLAVRWSRPGRGPGDAGRTVAPRRAPERSGSISRCKASSAGASRRSAASADARTWPTATPTDALTPAPPPCERAIVLTAVARHGTTIDVAGVVRKSYGGQPVTLLNGRQVLGHATVAQDGSFRTTLRSAARPGRVHAVVAAQSSRALKATRPLQITGRRPLSGGRLRATARVPGAGATVEVRVQTGCVRGRSRTIRTVAADRSGRVAVTLPTPSAVDAVASYRLTTRSPVSVSLPLVMTR
jgi:hypothetical protein